MKNKIAILSSLVCMLGGTAWASECIGDGCDFETFETFETVQVYSEPEPVWPDAAGTFDLPAPMRQVKLLDIKPVVPDGRPPLWDGSHARTATHTYTKTVDGVDGAPLWDDGVASYRAKDYSDWFIEPRPELYLRDVTPAADNLDIIEMYHQNMNDAAATRARVEELLSPKKPTFDMWSECAPQNYDTVVAATFVSIDGCPFNTETECNIWRRKPIVRETVSPRSPRIRNDKMFEFLDAAGRNPNISANDAAAAPLLARYKMLMAASNACCSDGMVYNLKQAGADDALIYKFMADDANFYGFGARCLMMTDKELDTKYPNTSTAVVAADVRNGCLCRGREWFSAMLAPFVQVYNAMPEFRDTRFEYRYTDGLGRDVSVSVNTDVQNVLNQISMCP